MESHRYVDTDICYHYSCFGDPALDGAEHRKGCPNSPIPVSECAYYDY